MPRRALRTAGVFKAEIDLDAALGCVWCRPRSPPTETELVKAVVGASRGTHHRYLAVSLRRWFRGDGAGTPASPNGS